MTSSVGSIEVKNIRPTWVIVGIAFVAGAATGLLVAVRPLQQAHFALRVVEDATQDELGPGRVFVALAQLQRLRTRNKEEMIESFEWQLDGALAYIAEHPEMFPQIFNEGSDYEKSLLGKARLYRLEHPVVQAEHREKIHKLLGIRDTGSNNGMQPDPDTSGR